MKEPKDVSPYRKGGLMYLSMAFVEELVSSLNNVIPEKIRQKEKGLDKHIKTLETCLDTHKEDIKRGRGVVVGKDIQEVRYITEVKPASKPKDKSKKKAKKSTR